MSAEKNLYHLFDLGGELAKLSRSKLLKICQSLQSSYQKLQQEHIELQQELAKAQFEASALRSELSRTEKAADKRAQELERTYDEARATLALESEKWRANNEDEFCKLIASTTHHLTTLQDKAERSTKRESFAGKQVQLLTTERDTLKDQVSALRRLIRTLQSKIASEL